MMFPINEEDTTLTWNGSDKHQFMIDYFDEVLALREAFANLPETSAMAPRSHLNVEPHIPFDVFYVVGSWPVPAVIGGDNPIKYVNPHRDDKHRYSNMYVRCQCGAFMRLVENKETPYDEKHEDCPTYYRYEARAEMARRRAASIKTLLRLYKPLRPNCQRFGYDDRFRGDLPESLQIDWAEEKEAGRKLLANTATELLRERTPKEIGEAYGVHWRVIHRAIDKYSDMEMNELQAIRRENGNAY